MDVEYAIFFKLINILKKKGVVLAAARTSDFFKKKLRVLILLLSILLPISYVLGDVIYLFVLCC